MTGDRVVDALLSSNADFELAVRELDPDQFVGIALAFLSALDTASLPNGEKERRLNVVLTRREFTPEELRTVALAGATLTSAVLRNAITTIVPADYRRLIHRSTVPDIAGPARPVQVTPASAATRISLNDDQSYSSVVMLSLATDPAAQTLLEAAGFAPLRFDALATLGHFLESSSDVCAFLVDSTFLERLDAAQQRELFRLLGRYSTFSFIRCQSAGLLISRQEIGTIVATAHCSIDVPAFDHLTFADQQSLQEAELALIDSARSRIRFGPVGRFLPEEISATQMQLLGSAMTRYTRRKRFNHEAQIRTISVRFLQGGTGAKVAFVRVNELPWPVIVKIDVYEQIRQEALRFKTFIEPHNRELRPEVHLHGGAALIIFDIIATAQSGNITPAPSLADVLEKFWCTEMFGEPLPNTEPIVSATVDAARHLAELNMLKCTSAEFSIRANPHLRYIKQSEDAGFNWGFPREVLDARGQAEEILRTREATGICHGDAHLGNVLIEGDRGHIIDYAYSGPGHPCADLAKLELSLFFQSFNPFGGDSELVSFQRSLMNPRNDYETLMARHGNLVRSNSNRLCVRLSVVVRDTAHAVLAAHQLDWSHYRAAKLLQAWQSLQSPNLPQSMVRSVIEALSLAD